MSTFTLPQVRTIRESIAYSIFVGLKPVYVYARRKRKPWNITFDQLGDLPPNTLGKDLYLFLGRNQLELLPKIEFHDVYHVLFQYGVSLKEETMVQFLPLGNGKRSLPLVVCILISAVFYPENWSEFRRAFQRGRQATTFHHWDLEPLLTKPTQEVREMIFGKNDWQDRDRF